MSRFAVIGLGRFGGNLAKALTATGAEVIGIDRDPRVAEQYRDVVTLAVCLDSSDKIALQSQGVGEVDAAVVSIGENFESAALTVAVLKELGVPQIIARAMTEAQGTILSKVGAHMIAFAERESALRWAHRLMLPRLEQYVEVGEDHSLVYLKAPAKFCDRTLFELRLRQDFEVNLVALRREVRTRDDHGTESVRTEFMPVPRPDTVIQPDDILILVGSNQALSKLPTE